jgi:acetylornithine aminotransferase
MVTFAKGIANGLPLGGVICNEKVADAVKPGCHGSTFGGNQIALAAASAVLELLTPEKLNEIVLLGESLLTRLQGLNHPLIKAVRGKGLIIGAEIIEEVEVKQIALQLLEAGVVTCTAGNNTLRLLPPFITKEADIEVFIEKLTKVLNKISETIAPMKGAECAH